MSWGKKGRNRIDHLFRNILYYKPNKSDNENREEEDKDYKPKSVKLNELYITSLLILNVF